MIWRSTGIWLAVAGILGGIILLTEVLPEKRGAVPALVLPALDPKAVTSVQVRPAGTNQLEIRAERAEAGGWRLSRPFPCNAEKEKVDSLLEHLARMVPATVITPAELRRRPSPDDEYGFSSPTAASIVISQGGYRFPLRVGFTTLPGDQVFLQVVGIDGAYVVDAELLKFLPDSVNAWRDRTFAHLDREAFNRVVVTNASRTFELHRGQSSSLWRIVRPLQARANHARVEDGLQSLQSLTIQRFVTDDPEADMESYGFQSPSLELALAKGTNLCLHLQFGGSPTNDPEQIFAKHAGQPSVVTVSRTLVTPWRASLNDFRDPHLVSLSGEVDRIEGKGTDEFALQRDPDQSWTILPPRWPADTQRVDQFFLTLGRLPIAEFVKDVVMETDLTGYGLAPPARRFVLLGRPAGTNSPVMVDLQFGLGTNNDGRVYARRTDESFVYAITTNDFAQLPWAGWQFRESRFWKFTEDDVLRLSIKQEGRSRQLLRKGPHDWSLAPGSQGVINDLAVEQTVKALAQTKAEPWIAQGSFDRAAFGFDERAHELTFELRDGTRHQIIFGKATAAGQYACVLLDESAWVFECPWLIYRDVSTYLVAP